MIDVEKMGRRKMRFFFFVFFLRRGVRLLLFHAARLFLLLFAGTCGFL